MDERRCGRLSWRRQLAGSSSQRSYAGRRQPLTGMNVRATSPGYRARVTVIVELVQPEASDRIADFSPLLTLSRHRVLTATNSRR